VSDAHLDRLESRLRERELDLLIVTDLVNLRWATGFTGSSGAAVVGSGTRTFVTDFRYLTQSADEVPDFHREIAQGELLAAVAGGLPDEGALRVGFDDATMSVRSHTRLRELVRDGIELVAAGGLVEELRAIKDADEVARIRAAARLADEACSSAAWSAAPSARSRSTSSSSSAAGAPRGSASRRSSPRASTARCPTPSPATCPSRRGRSS
jgi:Xaa-Pro aminopeptidase